MLRAFIDESGDLGQNEGYFIIAMLVAHDSNRIKNLIKTFCATHKLKEAHAFELTFPQKQFLINQLVKQQDYTVSYVIADKMMITNRGLFQSNNLLFNYLFSILVKDIIRANTDDLEIYLDNRTQKVASVNSLRDYIKIKALAEWGFEKKITIQYKDSRDCKPLQMADQIASCIRRNYVRKVPDLYSKLNIAKSTKFPRTTFREILP
jgi:hypothetical protein